MNMHRWRAVFAELIGTQFLLMIIVGSGIMAERLSAGNVALALLANALATGTGLYVLITTLGPLSGAHFNPLVSLYAAFTRQLTWPTLLLYLLAQISGAILGVWVAHAMFDLTLLQISTHTRHGSGQWISEAVASFGLLSTIILGQRTRSSNLPMLVGCYIFAAYWFTASTSFANPAVTLARSLTDTFSGIYPNDVPHFLMAQVMGLALTVILFNARKLGIAGMTYLRLLGRTTNA